MRYADARAAIKTGDVLAWSHRASPFASFYDFQMWIVRLFQRSEFSHVGISVVLAERVFVLESVSGGIRLMPLSKSLPCYLLPYKPIDLDRAMSVCGEPYSKFEAIRGWAGSTDATNHVWQCAEFVAWAHQLPCPSTPSGVVNYLLDQGYSMTEITE